MDIRRIIKINKESNNYENYFHEDKKLVIK